MSTLDDVRSIEHEPKSLVLGSGLYIEIQPLKLIQFFKLLRIVSHGAGQNILSLNFNPNLSEEEFAIQLLSIIAFSVPDAEDETLEFIHSMTKPVGLIENRELNKLDKERNQELWAQYNAALENPELEDFIIILEAIVKNEAEDLKASGKRLMAMFKFAQKTSVVPDLPTSQGQTSSEGSAAPSTSSPPSTDGQTKSSSDLL